MNKLFTVLRQEYLLKVRTKAFLFGTFVLPLLMGGLMVLPAVFMSMRIAKPMTVAVVDDSGALFEPLGRILADTSKTGEKLYNLTEEPAGARNKEDLASDLGGRVMDGKIGGFILIPRDVLTGGGAAFYAKNVSDFQRNETIERALERAVREIRIGRSNLDTSQVATILKKVPFTTFKVGEGGKAREDQGRTFGLAYAMGFIFYISLFIYGAMMLRAALEEKTSRSAEIMVATVRSSTLMGGKILGIGLVGLTQIAIWAALLGLFALYTSMSGMTIMGSSNIFAQIGLTLPMILFFVVYFIMGFLLYAGLFGAIGAMVNSETEAQQLQTPITLPIVAALMLMFVAIRDPNATVVRVCSMVPFFAPILMTVRICVIMPPAWEILLSLVILAASIAGGIWVAGRIFRVGLLMYGKRPDLPELMKWIRYG